MHEKPTNSHESDVSRVIALLNYTPARARAYKVLARWRGRLERDPSFTLGGRARIRLDALERVTGLPGYCGPPPLMAAHDEVTKRRAEERRPRRTQARLAPFLAAPGAVPMPRPPPLRR
jgi:hypothetical protein